jgi:tyrosyl-tRNA synthetase
MSQNNIDLQKEKLLKNTTHVLGLEQLNQKLNSGRKLRIKLGVDPTAKDITLGWAVVLRKLKEFQDLGHVACLVIGDFTASIGDPTGKHKTRKQLSDEEITTNVESIKEKIFKIIDPNKTLIYHNKQWYEKMNASQVINLCSKYTVARMLERDDFSNRLKENLPISMHEILYPLFQGMDSVELNADVEIGGNDQLFNTMVGRDLMVQHGQDPQVVILCPLLLGTDGKTKMSQSLGNYVSISDHPNEMFGKIMSIPDNLIESWFKLCTNFSDEKITTILSSNENPKDSKIILAKSIVEIYHSKDKAEKACSYFEEVFSKRSLTTEIPHFHLPNEESITLIDLVKFVEPSFSNTKIREFIKNGAVSINGKQFFQNYIFIISKLNNSVLKVGKKKFVRLVL